MKKAFTLAEVLITLAVIGVVAAMTIPALIQNYQKKTYVEGLKIGISIIEQGFKKAMADDGVTDFRNTELLKNCNYSMKNDLEQYYNDCTPYLKKYFKDIKTISNIDMNNVWRSDITSNDPENCKKYAGKVNKWYHLNDKNKCTGYYNLAFIFANGMRGDFFIRDDVFYLGSISLDINGSKGPNTWGRDVFYLRIMPPDGHIAPQGGYEYLKAYTNNYGYSFEDIFNSSHWTKVDTCSKTTTDNGLRCAARVIESGWKMDY